MWRRKGGAWWTGVSPLCQRKKWYGRVKQFPLRPFNANHVRLKRELIIFVGFPFLGNRRTALHSKRMEDRIKRKKEEKKKKKGKEERQRK